MAVVHPAVSGDDFRGHGVGVQVLKEVDGGGEEFRDALVALHNAQVKHAHKMGHQHLRQDGEEVEDEVEGGEGEGVAGEEDDQGGRGEVEEALPDYV